MTAAPPRAPAIPAPRRPVHAPAGERVDPATQRRRRVRFTATRAGIRLRGALLPGGSVRRRQAWQVCSAARLVTALGIRVDVVQPATPWPRHRTHRLQVTNDAGVLGDLALLTAVPRTTAGWADVADRVLPAGTALRTVALDPEDTVVCPVTIGFRTSAGHPTTPAEVVAAHGLVIEVRLLPAVGEADRAA